MEKNDIFLKNLKYFVENFNAITRNSEEHDKSNNSGKRVQKEINWDTVFNNIDIKCIEEIIRNNENPFSYFYDLKKEIQFKFFKILSKTELALIFFEKYSSNYQNMSTQDKRLIPKKINSVIEYLELKKIENENDKKLIEYLKGEVRTISNKHFTKNQIYQNLLYRINELICFIESKEIKKNPNLRSVKITNGLLKDYFEDEKKFSVKTNFSKFKEYNYFWQTNEPLILVHGK